MKSTTWHCRIRYSEKEDQPGTFQENVSFRGEAGDHRGEEMVNVESESPPRSVTFNFDRLMEDPDQYLAIRQEAKDYARKLFLSRYNNAVIA